MFVRQWRTGCFLVKVPHEPLWRHSDGVAASDLELLGRSLSACGACARAASCVVGAAAGPSASFDAPWLHSYSRIGATRREARGPPGTGAHMRVGVLGELHLQSVELRQ